MSHFEMQAPSTDGDSLPSTNAVTLASLPEDVYEIITSGLDFSCILNLGLTSRAFLASLTPTLAQHTIRPAYAPSPYPADFGCGFTPLIELTTDDQQHDGDATMATSSTKRGDWKLQLWIQAKLHEVLRQAEREEIRLQQESAINSATSSTNISPVKAASSGSTTAATMAGTRASVSPLAQSSPLGILSAVHTANILAQGIIIPAYKPPSRRPPRKLVGYEVDRPSVWTVHARALIEFVCGPAGAAIGTRPTAASSSAPTILLEAPHVAEAFARQLSEIHDRFLHAMSTSQRDAERHRQGKYFEEYEVFTEDPTTLPVEQKNDETDVEMGDAMDGGRAMNIASDSATATPSRPRQAYLYNPLVDTFIVHVMPPTTLATFVRLLRSSMSSTSLSASSSEMNFLALGIRALSILALRDENRLGMVGSGAVQLVLDAMRSEARRSASSVTVASSHLVSNCAFALVVFARPLGSSEGATFFHPLNLTNTAVSMIMHPTTPAGASTDPPPMNGADLLSALFRLHCGYPSTLAKLAWAMVNLSNEEACKAKMVRSGILQQIADVLTSEEYAPNPSATATASRRQHRDLHLRLVLAHLNLVNHPRVREIVVQGRRIFHTLLRLLQAYPYFWTLQRHCAILLRALASAGCGGLIRAEFPGLVECCLRFYLHCLPASLHPNPDCREILLQTFEFLAIDQQQQRVFAPAEDDAGGGSRQHNLIGEELERVNEEKRRRGEDELEMVFGRDEEAEPRDEMEEEAKMDTQSSGRSASASTSSVASPSSASPPTDGAASSTGGSLSPRSLLLADRLSVESEMSSRRTEALVQWHQAALVEERMRQTAAAAAASDADDRASVPGHLLPRSLAGVADDATLREQHPLAIPVFGRPLSRIEFHMQLQVLAGMRQHQQARAAVDQEEEDALLMEAEEAIDEMMEAAAEVEQPEEEDEDDHPEAGEDERGVIFIREDVGPSELDGDEVSSTSTEEAEAGAEI